jgi:hypothetical protein
VLLAVTALTGLVLGGFGLGNLGSRFMLYFTLLYSGVELLLYLFCIFIFIVISIL